MSNSQAQRISIIQELELSIETIKSALSIIQRMEFQKTPSFLIFVLLSTGIERLFKVIIGLRLLSDGEKFPSVSDLKNSKEYGHNLTKMKSKILTLCFKDNQKPQIVKEDREFLENDTLLKELLAHLTDFSLSDRYVYMNSIANEEFTGKWLSHRWEEIERIIISPSDAAKLISDGKANEYKEFISHSLVVVIEKLLGVMCRTITLGKMDSDANSAGTLLFEFLFLRKSDLGKRRYDLFGFSPI
jgi:hypothetical protein